MQSGQVLETESYRAARRSHGEGFTSQTGAQAIRTLLRQLDVPTLAKQLRKRLGRSRRLRPTLRTYLQRRLRLVEMVRQSGQSPDSNGGKSW